MQVVSMATLLLLMQFSLPRFTLVTGFKSLTEVKIALESRETHFKHKSGVSTFTVDIAQSHEQQNK